MATPLDTHENDLIRRLPRHLKMGELRVFVPVMDCRSFRKAAAVRHLTQPAITKVIAGLEDKLGVRLFNRPSHGVEPRLHAQSFAPRAFAIFEELRRAAQDRGQVSSGARRALCVGTVPISATPLPAALQRLTAAQPGASISLVEARKSNLIERMRKRDIELPAPVREVSAVCLGWHEPGPLAQMLIDQLRTLAARGTRSGAEMWITARARRPDWQQTIAAR